MCVPVSARKVHDVGAVVKQAADQLVVRTKALFPAEIYPLAGGRTDVSSTAIRAQIRMTGECPAMLPGEVWELIKRYHLYGVSNLGE